MLIQHLTIYIFHYSCASINTLEQWIYGKITAELCENLLISDAAQIIIFIDYAFHDKSSKFGMFVKYCIT